MFADHIKVIGGSHVARGPDVVQAWRKVKIRKQKEFVKWFNLHSGDRKREEDTFFSLSFGKKRIEICFKYNRPFFIQLGFAATQRRQPPIHGHLDLMTVGVARYCHAGSFQSSLGPLVFDGELNLLGLSVVHRLRLRCAFVATIISPTCCSEPLN